MKRRGIPIEDYPIKGSVNVGISYTTAYVEWEAAQAAGLDLWKWETGAYPVDFKNRVIAWHRLRGLVQLNVADATRPKTPPGGNKSNRRRPRRR